MSRRGLYSTAWTILVADKCPSTPSGMAIMLSTITSSTPPTTVPCRQMTKPIFWFPPPLRGDSSKVLDSQMGNCSFGVQVIAVLLVIAALSSSRELQSWLGDQVKRIFCKLCHLQCNQADFQKLLPAINQVVCFNRLALKAFKFAGTKDSILHARDPSGLLWWTPRC